VRAVIGGALAKSLSFLEKNRLIKNLDGRKVGCANAPTVSPKGERRFARQFLLKGR
jgi:hypothetical protein